MVSKNKALDMGQAPSQEELDSVGYRVLGVQPNSPAATAGLVSFFDFVIAANSCPLKVLDQTLVEMIKDSEDKPLPLTIFNIKSETTRDVVITPRRGWGGQGMLGVTIRFDSFWRAEEALVRVLEVVPDSPAELAGLEAEKDYLLGTAEKVFKDTDALYEEVRAGGLLCNLSPPPCKFPPFPGASARCHSCMRVRLRELVCCCTSSGNKMHLVHGAPALTLYTLLLVC